MQLVDYRYISIGRQRCDTCKSIKSWQYYFYFFSEEKKSASNRATVKQTKKTKKKIYILFLVDLTASIAHPSVLGCRSTHTGGCRLQEAQAPLSKFDGIVESSRMSLLVRGASAKLRAVARRCELQLHVCGQAIFRTSPEPHK